jgi:hypothetical protein
MEGAYNKREIWRYFSYRHACDYPKCKNGVRQAAKSLSKFGAEYPGDMGAALGGECSFTYICAMHFPISWDVIEWRFCGSQ